MRCTRYVRPYFAMWLILLMFGCGAGNNIEHIDVSGRVTYRGQPIEDGTVTFDPQGRGPVVVARILNGDYKATGQGGVPVGVYTVRISATAEDRDAWVEGAMPEPPRKELLPARYNLQSDLTREASSGARVLEMNFALD